MFKSLIHEFIDYPCAKVLSTSSPMQRYPIRSETPEMYYRNHSQGASTLGFRFYVEVKSTFIWIAPSARMQLARRFSLQRETVKRPTSVRWKPRESESLGGLFRKLHFVTHVRKKCARSLNPNHNIPGGLAADSNTRIFMK